MNKKIVILALALVLVFGCAVGGTLAWLSAKTESVINTFTVGNITLSLEETLRTYKMVPGVELEKDPTVTVGKDSEKCWVFIKIEEFNNLDDFITYTVDSEWTELQDGVYYLVQEETKDAAASYNVLAGNVVTVRADVTKEQLGALTTDTYPQLKFTAYAVQYSGFDTAQEAWAEASKLG